MRRKVPAGGVTMHNELRIEKENDPLLRQATEWALEMWDKNAPVERVAEWQSWLGADARHREAFARVEELMGVADRVQTVAYPDKGELAADAYDGAISVSEWKNQITSVRTRTRFRRPVAYAAAATVLLGVALVLSGYPQEFTVPGLLAYKRMETPAGGTRKLTLMDGSGVDIGGRSSLRAIFTQDARRVTLEEGEAFFRVAKDATRPFTVRAGDTTITAVGTAFNVRRSGERVVVSVAEGAVRVDALRHTQAGTKPVENLVAGQQLDVEPRTRELTVATIETSAVAGWRDGRFRYLNEALSSVIVDVARYTGREIELAEPSIGELRITGTVLERNLEGWLTSLEETFQVQAIRRADGSIRLERT